jgi:RsiW-degrading membrane proteinase PrsW (M82 family)
METYLPDIANLFFFTTLAVYALLVVFMLVWQYHDAEQRGVMGWLVVIPSFMTGTLLGVVLWLMFRPAPKPTPVYVRASN